MITEVSITVRPDEEKNQDILNKKILAALNEKHISAEKHDILTVFEKKSIDARHGQVKIFLRYKVYIDEQPENSENSIPKWKHADGSRKVIIIGSGPAGLFAAFRLLEDGIKPVIIERGNSTSERKKDIASISTKGILNENSNFCFGAGGAGTFSDGKLYTRSNKRGNISKIYRIFVEFGASEDILTDSHPHIGTDRLPQIIDRMKEKICELGGEFHLNTLCTGLITDNSTSKVPSVSGIKVKDLNTQEEKILTGDAVVLATGHSATDIYRMIAEISPESLEAKTFAVGVRVEHPRSLIDEIQFHGKKMPSAAEYKLTTQAYDRGVYSFCMCPGGFVVPTATSEDEIVVNGMSSSGRNSRWSNAAIVVECRTEDIPEEFIQKASDDGFPALAGLYWRTWLEQETKRHGNGQKAPAQRLTDFIEKKESENLPPTSYTAGLVSSRLDQWLPEHISKRLEKGFKDFDRNMKGFICSDALLIASETRTSTPVRILRNKESLECIGIKRLYPVGEGSGYSGGIGSSAIDGENAAAILSRLLKD